MLALAEPSLGSSPEPGPVAGRHPPCLAYGRVDLPAADYCGGGQHGAGGIGVVGARRARGGRF